MSTRVEYVDAARAGVEWMRESDLAAQVHLDFRADGHPVLVLWGDDVVVVDGTPDEIRTLLRRALDLLEGK